MIYTSFHMQQYLPVWDIDRRKDVGDDDKNKKEEQQTTTMTKNNGTERTEKKGHRYEEEVDAYCPAA